MIRLHLILIPASLTSCALVTVPVKVAGKAATTTISVTGKAVGAGFDAFGGDEVDVESESEE